MGSRSSAMTLSSRVIRSRPIFLGPPPQRIPRPPLHVERGSPHRFRPLRQSHPFSYSWSADLDKTIRANAIAVDPNGKILVAGRASQNSGGPHFALARLNANGSLDTTFSGDGKLFTSFGWSAPSEALAIAVRGTSSIMLAGWSGTGVSRSAVVTRYTATGGLDTTFDGDGRAAANLSCEGAERATAIALLTGTGRFQTLPHIYVAGYANGDPCRSGYTMGLNAGAAAAQIGESRIGRKRSNRLSTLQNRGAPRSAPYRILHPRRWLGESIRVV